MEVWKKLIELESEILISPLQLNYSTLLYIQEDIKGISPCKKMLGGFNVHNPGGL